MGAWWPYARPMDVPFLDLSLIHAPLKDAILTDLGGLIDRSEFINGPQVAAFEDEYAAFTGTRRCVGLASGTDALRLGLLAAGLKPGDEVIVPANTFIATLEAVRQAGGVPVPVDVNEGDYGMNVDAAAAAIGERTRALLPVHLYGQMADMQALGSLARRAGLFVIEDACQAHGARRDDLTAGACGLAGAFSFYPGKNLGAMGDAGALVTDDDGLAERVSALREHGQRRKYTHELEGYTSRLDALQAVVLRHKLPLLEGWNDERRMIAQAYDHALGGVGDLVLPPVAPGSVPVYHLYVVRTAHRGALADSLAARGIATGRHYPEPVHLSGAFSYLGHGRGSFPVTEALADEVLSLPIFPGMDEEQVAAVTAAVQAAFAGDRSTEAAAARR